MTTYGEGREYRWSRTEYPELAEMTDTLFAESPKGGEGVTAREPLPEMQILTARQRVAAIQAYTRALEGLTAPPK